MGKHPSAEDFERYQLGLLSQAGAPGGFEEHLIACPECARRAEETAAYVEALRAAMVEFAIP